MNKETEKESGRDLEILLVSQLWALAKGQLDLLRSLGTVWFVTWFGHHSCNRASFEFFFYSSFPPDAECKDLFNCYFFSEINTVHWMVLLFLWIFNQWHPLGCCQFGPLTLGFGKMLAFSHILMTKQHIYKSTKWLKDQSRI